MSDRKPSGPLPRKAPRSPRRRNVKALGGGRHALVPAMEILEARALLAAFVVTNTGDSGVGTLRYEAAQADAAGGTNYLTFASGVNGQITLTSGEIDVTDQTLVVTGPGETTLTISGNANSRIFHVENGSTLALNDLTLDHGHVSGDGGAVLVDTASATVAESLSVNDVNFLDNTSTGNGGAIAFEGSTTLASSSRIINSQFNGNIASSAGGAVEFSGGTLLIQNSTFTQNSATNIGGALSVDAGAVMVQSSTFDTNNARLGGAIIDDNSSVSLGIFATTIARNSAQYGGGIDDPTPTADSLQDSIVAGNTATVQGPDINGEIKSLGYNLFKSVSGITFTTGQQSSDIVSATPGVGVLGNYGGPTPTDPLLPGSPALMHGLNDNGGVDQRGVSLVDNTSYSIGAFFGAGFLVSNTGDNSGSNPPAGAGTGTLSQALVDADSYATGDGQATIAFDIPGTGTQTITILAALPFINSPVDIDGSTQPGYAGSPLVNVLGDGTTNYEGFLDNSSNVTIRALAIGGFVNGAILSTNVNALTIAGDYIGVGPDGVTAEPNAMGIDVSGTNITIGGPNSDDQNVIGDNNGPGVILNAGNQGNLIENNLVGITPSSASAPNTGDGIDVYAANLTVGVPSLGNSIDNNLGQGIDLELGSGGDLVQSNNLLNNGNFAAGLGAYAFYGLNIASNNNTIGGTGSTYANVFNQTGVHIGGTQANDNLLENNRIGTDPTGLQGLGTYYDGIDIDGGANHNTIGAGNVISANADGDGINISGAGASFNLVTGSLIGVDVNGSNGLFNLNGVEIQGGATNNTITASVISANTNDGVLIHDTGTSGNVISNDEIGTDVTASFGGLDYGLENGSDGVEIYNAATNNTLSGDVISGNSTANVSFSGPGTSGNVVQNSLIGTDATGEFAIDTSGATVAYGINIASHASGNVVQGNVISGNTNSGIFLANAANNNQIVGNTIGVDKLGQFALPNNGDGIDLAAGPGGTPFQNQIGGAGALGNTISGNTSNGVEIGAETAPNGLTNWISGDGTTLDQATGGSATIDGTVGYANLTTGGQGFSFDGTTGDNVVADASTAAFDTANFSIAFGIQSSQTGIDTAVISDTGSASDGGFVVSYFGGQIVVEAFQPGLGATEVGYGGSISDGLYHEIVLTRSGPSLSLYVDGTLAQQKTGPLLNFQNSGVLEIGDSSYDSELGDSPFTGTVSQVQVYNRSLSLPDVQLLSNTANAAGGNVIQGNKIGTDSSGTIAIPNQNDGISGDGSSHDLIGGLAAGDGNLISGNATDGIQLQGPANGSSLVDTYQGEGNPFDGVTGQVGTITGNVDYAPGKLGQAFDFPAGQDNHVNVSPGALSPFDFSISFWVQTLDTAANVPLYGNRATSGLGTFLDISLHSGFVYAEVDDGTAAGDVQTTGTSYVADGSYHMITVVRQGTNLTIYEDGNFDTSSSAAVEADLTGATGFEIGSEPLVAIENSPSYTSFVGQIDEVRVYNTATFLNVANLYLDGNEGGTRILGNFIGTTANGLAALGNGYDGLEFDDDETGDIVGGTASGAGNVIAGNDQADVYITQGTTTADLFQGNLIGLNSVGNATLNTGGTELLLGTGGNTIGGTTDAARNFISGGTLSGANILLSNYQAVGNLIEGNYIGTDETGLVALGRFYGIDESGPPQGNTYGGTVAGAGNLIVGTIQSGVFSYALVADSYDLIAGNLFDTNKDGTAVLGGTTSGILISGSNNTVGGTTALARNVLPVDAIDVTGSNNLIEGNYVGLGSSGTGNISNTQGGGIYVAEMGNTIGGTVTGAGNVVGNTNGDAITLNGSGATHNLIEGNLIGTDKTGLAAAFNTGASIALESFAEANTIGGTSAGARNVISGSTGGGRAGIFVDVFSGFNLIEGNYIGTDSTGNAPIEDANGLVINSSYNTIGGTVAGAGNIITAMGYGTNGNDPNTGWELWLGDNNASFNLVEGNRIGVGVSDAVIAGQSNAGVLIESGSFNTIGGTTAAARNVIAGNDGGVLIEDTDATGNQVEGNYIGTDTTGLIGLGNGPTSGGAVFFGVYLLDAGQNTIGGSVAGSGNVIADDYAGVRVRSPTGSLIEGNFIGTDRTGAAALGNDVGVIIFGGGNTVGGTLAEERNVISANSMGGVDIQSLFTGNLVQGNDIGTDLTGTLALGNTLYGIGVFAPGTTIGGTAPGAGNVIAATKSTGPTSGTGAGIFASGNEFSAAVSLATVIEGNQIGGPPGLGNAGAGVEASEGTIFVGGTASGAGNVIAYNSGAGVQLMDPISSDSSVRQNRIIGNSGGGVTVAATGPDFTAPTLMEASVVGGFADVKGMSVAGAVLEFFISASGQGAVY